MMNSLIANYGSSSDSSSESDSDTERNKEISDSGIESTPTESKLPGPDFITSFNSEGKRSVFFNTFTQAEHAKKAILEQHVKMVSTKDNTRIINGKKVCWNYRKGRCRFGHKCKYAHDSDLQLTPEELAEQNKIQSTVICQSDDVTEPRLERNEESEIKNKGKKRPGLCQTLVPNKKVMKMYRSGHIVK